MIFLHTNPQFVPVLETHCGIKTLTYWTLVDRLTSETIGEAMMNRVLLEAGCLCLVVASLYWFYQPFRISMFVVLGFRFRPFAILWALSKCLGIYTSFDMHIMRSDLI